MKRILIIEDDINIAKMIKRAVEIKKYIAHVEYTGNRGLELINSNEFDLILLDIMLPELDGFKIISKRTSKTPIIFITAKQDIADKVKGLKLGAEDYIVKPFEIMELLARIEVVLRRYNNLEENLTFENIYVDINEHICKYNNKDCYLTPKEFDLLVFFLNHPDVIITRKQLLSSVWGFDFEGETRTVDTHIQQLGKKLDLKDKLVTVPKYGYRLNTCVSERGVN